MSPVCYPQRAGEPYRPSNGTEGEIFMADWCDVCSKHKDCPILTATLCYEVSEPEYPRDFWVYDAGGRPKCKAFQRK